MSINGNSDSRPAWGQMEMLGGRRLHAANRTKRTVSRRNLHGRVAYTLGRQIVSGEVAEGELLSTEEAASADLAVSRTAYREAIKLLSAKGLVESRPKVGTRVRARTEWNMLDPDVLLWASEQEITSGFTDALFEFRVIIEPAAARMAADKQLRGPLEDVRKAMAVMARSAPATQENINADLEFHTSILRASGNELLSSLWYVTEALLARSLEISSRLPGAREASMPLHQAVCDRILKGEGAKAEDAMKTLLTRARKDVEAVVATLNEEHLTAGTQPLSMWKASTATQAGEEN